MKEQLDTRKIAIYSRKSKYTGKGESTANQIELCKKKISYQFEHINLEEDVLIYEDEGFTGYNMNRPAFQKMLQDIKENKIKVIAFYKLDRISRNVTDFSKLVTELENFHVTFLSATESIENISPSGRAMMYMISVFAQLERDTIAERIKDNMLELAKTGRWLGGIPPTGYASKQIEEISIEGKKRKLYQLVQSKDIDKIKTIFAKMLLFQSLTKLETYLLNHEYKTTNEKYFTRWSLRNILTNPVYAIADADTFLYFKKNYLGFFAKRNEFDGIHGLMVYNKTQKKGPSHSVTKRERNEWIVAVGKHRGIISGALWIRVQEILKMNENMRYRKTSTHPSLLSGLIRCDVCSSYLRAKLRPKQGERQKRKFDYICELKEKSHKKKCSCPNSNGLLVDSSFLKSIASLPIPTSKLVTLLRENEKKMTREKNSFLKERKILESKYKKNEEGITSFIHILQNIDKELLKEVEKEIKKLKDENAEIQKRLQNLFCEEEKKIDIKKTANHLFNYYLFSLQELDQKDKNKLLKSFLQTITSDGKKITLYFIGAELPTSEDSK